MGELKARLGKGGRGADVGRGCIRPRKLFRDCENAGGDHSGQGVRLGTK